MGARTAVTNTKVWRFRATRRQTFTCGLVLLGLGSLAFGQSEVRAPTRIAVPDLGALELAPRMEVQGERLRALKKQLGSTEAKDPDLMSELVIQQIGLNDQTPQALGQYVRIVVETRRMSQDPRLTLDSARTFSANDLDVWAREFRAEIARGGAAGPMQVGSPRVGALGNAHALTMDYTRQGQQGQVFVQHYTVFNFDRYHDITVSYRASEAAIWHGESETVLASLVFTDTRHPTTGGSDEHTLSGSRGLSILSTLLVDAFRDPLSGSGWANVVAYLLFCAVLTWGIGLTPPLLIRFVILRRPLSKLYAVVGAGVFFVSNLIIFTVLGSRSKTHAALALVACVSYWILRKQRTGGLDSKVPATNPAVGTFATSTTRPSPGAEVADRGS